MSQVYESFDEMWLHIVDHLCTNGHRVASRDGDTLETLAYNAVLANPDQAWLTVVGRKASASYAAAELLWYLSGTEQTEMLQFYAPQYKRFVRADGTAPGAYGARWAKHDQLESLLSILRGQSGSRQAVMTMYSVDDLTRAGKGDQIDIPCTLSLQFLCRRNTLNLIATMRSNDVWLGMPYDVWTFTRMQGFIAGILGMRVGFYCHQAGSMHLYERNFPKEGTSAERITMSRVPLTAVPQSYGDLILQVRETLERERAARVHGLLPKYREEPNVLDEALACCAYKIFDKDKRVLPTWMDPRIFEQ